MLSALQKHLPCAAAAKQTPFVKRNAKIFLIFYFEADRARAASGKMAANISAEEWKLNIFRG